MQNGQNKSNAGCDMILSDFDLVESLKASNVRRNPCAFLQDSGEGSAEE